ncbi:hypothetical protein [Falsiroseomonas bella]|uniref:hypothetical protein n=1 Tax=Falsiroseomonas bella TaxID=2184016 RepID=UPI001304AC0C|nr:hypothetical protein [Falsiroseomonas bella]
MSSIAGRRLRRLGFAQATVTPTPAAGLCAGRIRGLGLLRRPLNLIATLKEPTE